MTTNAKAGVVGEKDVVKKVRCPNCRGFLSQLPKNYPLYDVQCTQCSFRAQVKTNLCEPKDQIFGAGWDVLDKVLKSGFTVPPLIVNWRPKGRPSKQEIRFYPFIPKKNLRKRQLSSKAKRANYRMFNYVGLESLPHFPLFKASSK